MCKHVEAYTCTLYMTHVHVHWTDKAGCHLCRCPASYMDIASSVLLSTSSVVAFSLHLVEVHPSPSHPVSLPRNLITLQSGLLLQFSCVCVCACACVCVCVCVCVCMCVCMCVSIPLMAAASSLKRLGSFD